MSDYKIDLATVLAGDDSERRPSPWAPRTADEAEARYLRPIPLFTHDGQVSIQPGLDSSEPTASITANGGVIGGISLTQCGALIEALCEAEWYLIGPPT